MQSTPRWTMRFELPAGQGRKARAVEQAVRVQRLSVSDQLGGQLEVSCLIATEIDPPSGVKPVQWRLLTNLAVSSLQDSAELIDWYRARWEIELFFLILNEGCRVEQLQLGNIEQLQSALAIYLVISWRINRLMRLGRALPDLPVDLLFERAEWRTAFILNKKPVPKQVPTINTVIRLIAQRGGGLGRKHDGEPGARTLWQGLREPGGLGGTYAVNPLAVAAAHAVIEVMHEEKLPERGARLGAQLQERLQALSAQVPQIAEVRGLGAMVAVELRDPASGAADAEFTRRVQAEALARGLILLSCGTEANVLRFLFPLSIPDALFAEALDILEAALRAA